MVHLLMVEDARDLAAVTARELEASGYQVTHVWNGAMALSEVEKTTFDLIILDWMLPDMDGLEVLRRLRAASPIPVLMLTARDSEIDRVLGLEIGADDYLTKPFSMRELIARIRAMLRRRELILQTLVEDRRGATGSAVQVGALKLDPEAYFATLDQEPLDLTRTEFALLSLLVHNPGRVFSRSYLLDTIWGEGYVDGDRSVDNAILRVRKKLKGMGEMIETVWGVGYRWQRS